jgi:uncharacterized membrane protein
MQEPIDAVVQALASAFLFSLGGQELILAALVALAFVGCGVKTLLGAGTGRRQWRMHRP